MNEFIRQWTIEELTAHYGLTENDAEIIRQIKGNNRFPYAILYKWFQLNKNFPENKEMVDGAIIDFVSQELKEKKQSFDEYNWDSRTYRWHCEDIRTRFGYRNLTPDDISDLRVYLQIEVLSEYDNNDVIYEMVIQRFKTLKLIPPATGALTRLIASEATNYQNQFLEKIFNLISTSLRKEIDSFVEQKDEKRLGLSDIRSNPKAVGVNSVFIEIEKLKAVRSLAIPTRISQLVSRKQAKRYSQQVTSEDKHEILRHPQHIKYPLICIYLNKKSQDITDNLVELLIQITHKIYTNSTKRVNREVTKSVSGVVKKNDMLLKLAEISLNNPDGIIKNVVYPIAGTETLKSLIDELQSTSHTYQAKVYSYFRKSYSGHYRRMIPLILDELVFRSNNDAYQPLIKAIEAIRLSNSKRFLNIEDIPIENVLKQNYQDMVIEKDEEGIPRINRINYEIGVLQSLRDKLRCKEIWVEGAEKYGDPDKDLPADFDINRDNYYEALHVPKEADEFIEKLKIDLSKALITLNDNLPKNPKVSISNKDNGWIHLGNSEPQTESTNIPALKQEISNRWPMTSLLDILKEADIRIGFTDKFKTVGNREILDRHTLQKRILMVLYGLGTNTGLKRVVTADSDVTYKNLLHIENKYVTADALRNANAEITNAIFKIRKAEIWGPESTTCASDSKQFSSWDQNLRTEWHNRYHGRGIMIYWHVEKGSTCIHSQIKTCSSSEVASMIEGLIRHNTTMKVDKNFTDTHGQSLIAFAFSHILGFHLMPRFKAIQSQKLFLPDVEHKDKLKNLAFVLAKNSIDWDLIKQNYDQIIKYTTAIRLGTADTDTILKRFTKNSVKHPVYLALQELGKVIKTIFLCQYLDSEALRIEINEGLNIVENWNSATTFIFFAKGRIFSSNSLENQEVSMLALHLLQNCLVYINTLMIQSVLAEEKLFNSFKEEDFRALTPLIYEHINPYGIFELDMDERIDIKDVA